MFTPPNKLYRMTQYDELDLLIIAMWKGGEKNASLYIEGPLNPGGIDLHFLPVHDMIFPEIDRFPGGMNMKRDFKLYWTLFSSTFFLSAFTFGGGFVIVPLMKKKFSEVMDPLKLSQHIHQLRDFHRF